MIERLLPAQRRFFFECAGIAVLTLLWLVCLVLGLGGQQTTQAISNFGLAIDDFGTGCSSSLSCLHRFPVDILKIDRSFVERLSHASDNAELAWTVVRLGQSLQLVTVAEGVEDSAQFLALRRMGCDVGQGHYFGRPMAGDMDRLVGDELTVARTATTA